MLDARQCSSDVLLCAHVAGDRYVVHAAAPRLTTEGLFVAKARPLGEESPMSGDASCAVMALSHWMAEKERASGEKRQMSAEVARKYMDVRTMHWEPRPKKVLLLWCHEFEGERVQEASAPQLVSVRRCLGLP